MVRSGDQKKSFNVKQRLSCGVGHVFNDLFRHLYMSFEIVFLMQVVELPAFQAGMILLITRVVEAFFSLFIGYLCDRMDIPLISKRMGRRKSWHLAGTLLMALTLPFLYNKCLLCSNHKAVGWAQFAYYVCISVAGNVSFSVVEINHLSVISAVTRTLQEGMAVNAIRTAFSFLTGIFVYLIAWGLLGHDSGESLGPEDLSSFGHLSWIATVTGIVFTIVFYIGTKESKASTHQEVRDDEKGKSSATLELRVLQHEREENNKDSEQAHFSTCPQENNSACLISEAGCTLTPVSEGCEKDATDAEMEGNAHDMSYESSLKDYSDPTHSEIKVNGDDMKPCLESANKAPISSATQTEKSRKHSFSGEKEQGCDNVEQKEEDNDDVALNMRDAFTLEIIDLPETETRETPLLMKPEEHGSNEEEKERDSAIKCELAAFSVKTFKDWLVDPNLFKVAVIFTFSRLLQDATYSYLPLYLTKTQGFEKQAVAYFPLVLLISATLGSAVSNKLSSKFKTKWTFLAASLLVILGCVFSFFQTQTSLPKQSTYAPVIVMGSGMSIMYVMALTFATELTGKDKKSSGSAFSIIFFIGRVSSGGMFMTIQELYPKHGSSSGLSESEYVRYVFFMVPGLLTLIASLMVLVSSPSKLCSCSAKRDFSPIEQTFIATEADSYLPEAVSILEIKP